MVTRMSGSFGRPGSSEIGNATTPRSPPPLAAAVLEGVRRRDVSALGEFFDHYFDCIYGLAYRLLGNRSGAEHATRETLRRILRWACRLDPQSDSLSWVVTVTVHTCESFRRRSSQRANGDPKAPESGRASVDHGLENRLGAGGRGQRIHEAISDLSESLRTVVILHDFQGLDETQIAELTGSTRNAIRRRYSTALSTLAEKLHELLE